MLVMGMTFKENVSDIRNSKVADIINEFKDFGAEVDVMDPFASFGSIARVRYPVSREAREEI